MEKIKRANNLWTSDSLFLRPTLSIPIDKPKIEEDSLNGGGGSESNGHQLDRSLNSTSSSNTSTTYLNGNCSLMNNSSSSNEHNNNLDYKISLNEIRPDLSDSTVSAAIKPSTSSQQNLSDSNESNEMLRGKDESMDDFLSRIDQYIKQSKVKMDSFANSSEIISSRSDDDLFKLHSYGYHTKSSYRQQSLRNNEIGLHEIRDKHNHDNREIIYSLRKLEKEQEEREKYEL